MAIGRKDNRLKRIGAGIARTSRGPLRAGMFLALAAAAMGIVPSWAGGPLGFHTDPYKATTSRAARQSALASIPYAKLDDAARAKVDSVLSDVAIFRRMPIRVNQCDPDIYLFLVRHPDVVTNIWEVLRLAKLSVHQTAPGKFELSDQAGTRGKAEILYASPTTHLIYTEGSYEGPLLLRPARGSTLLILKTGYVLEPNGRYYITSRLDAFVRVEQIGAELLTKTFQPLVGKVADANFIQTTGFVGSLSRTAEVNHQGVERLAQRLSKVPPEVRQQFARLSAHAAEKAAKLPTPTGPDPPNIMARLNDLERK